MVRRRPEPTKEELLRDIVAWGERLTGHVAGLTAEEFLRDARTQDAACRCIEALGEVARRLMAADPGIEGRHPEFALPQACGARNRIAHGYFSVDYVTVWVAARGSVPRMVAAARVLLGEQP